MSKGLHTINFNHLLREIKAETLLNFYCNSLTWKGKQPLSLVNIKAGQISNKHHSLHLKIKGNPWTGF